MKYVLQLFTGSFSERERNAGADEIIARLGEIFSLIPVEHVLFGWHTGFSSNKSVVDYIHANGKKAWLWAPVFSETPESVDSDRQVGYLGTGTASGEKASGLDFNFACPSSEKNRSITFDLFIKHFAGVGFDGVFLDKIRQGGFADGLERALGCFCPRCKARYSDAGVDTDRLISKVVENPGILLPSAYADCRYGFEDSDVDGYYRAKAACISEGIIGITDRFKGIGVEVGLDTFAPLAAWFVGQDIPALGKHVSFIKPMLYRRTNLPAGLPYEMNSIAACISGEQTHARFRSLWGVDDVISEDSARKQFLDMVRHGCVTYPGFEIFRFEDDTPGEPSYATSSAALYAQAGAEQVVLSYNILENTGQNIRALGNMPFSE